MELSQLRYFQVAARLQHMTRAAQALAITQPSLSQAIAKLEAELGALLFERQGRIIRLNPFGTAFLTWVDQALDAIDAGAHEVADLAGLDRGSIRLGLHGLRGLVPLIQGFLREHPQVALRILKPPLAELRQHLIDGTIDLAITYPFDHPDIVWHPLYTHEIGLVVPIAHRLAGRERIALSEVADENFVLLRPGQAFRELVDGFCRSVGFTPRTIVAGDTSALDISDLVRAGLGITFGTFERWHHAVAARQDVVMLRIVEPHCQLRGGLAWNQRHYRSAAARAFAALIIASFAQRDPIASDVSLVQL